MTEGNDARNIARLRSTLANLMLKSDEPDPKAAERLLKRARKDLAASSASQVDLVRCDLQLAEAALAQGDNDRAAELAEAALADDALVAPLRADAHIVLGRVAHSQRKSAAARKHFQAAAAAMSEGGRDRAAAATWFQLGELLDELGEAELARDAYRSAAAAGGVQLPTARRAPVLLPTT
jgi:tetratricopeptide (TPR) repeat protein